MENDGKYFNYSSNGNVTGMRRKTRRIKQKTMSLAAFNKDENVLSKSENSKTVENGSSIGYSNASDDNGTNNDDETSRGNTSSISNEETYSRTLRLSRDAVPFRDDEKTVNEPEDVKQMNSHSPENPNEQITVIHNTRALDKYATTYELEKFRKNALIIFNHEYIDGHERRLGTEKDLESLNKTFRNLGFEVDAHTDLTRKEIFKELEKFIERDFTDYGCIAVAVMTHGSRDGLLRARDQQYSEIEIINRFRDDRKLTLVTKPKVIFIQACRGNEIMRAVPVHSKSQSGRVRKDHDKDNGATPYFLPMESDLLILHSSYMGGSAHRHEYQGSWFIQTLCSKIDTLARTHDLESIITEVKKIVAIDYEFENYDPRTMEMCVHKQIPVMTSTLIRKLYLRRFRDQHAVETLVDEGTTSNDSGRQVLDTVRPTSPSLGLPLGPCLCFLEHFTYLRNCLSYYTQKYPDDEEAKCLLDTANTFEDRAEFNNSKEKTAKLISKYLERKTQSSDLHAFLYLYR